MTGLTRKLGRGVGTWLDTVAPRIVVTGLADAETWDVDRPGVFCPRCGVSLTAGTPAPDDTPCEHCDGQRLPWQRVTRLGPYREPLSRWLKAMKFHRQWAWGPWLGQRLAEAVPMTDSSDGDESENTPVWVTPVPMPWRRRWRRGYNQSKLIAEALAEQRGWRCVELLHRTRHTPPQTAVAPSQRAQNVSRSIAAHPVNLEGQRIVLVDDILTTGSTLRNCARALRSRGARQIDIAVAAVAEPKDPSGFE